LVLGGTAEAVPWYESQQYQAVRRSAGKRSQNRRHLIFILPGRTKLTNNVSPLRLFQRVTLNLLGVLATRLGRGDKQFPQAVAHG
jgi:hypothetical protein